MTSIFLISGRTRFRKLSTRSTKALILDPSPVLLRISSLLQVGVIFVSLVKITTLTYSPPDTYDVNVSPDKRTIFLHSEGNLVAALKVRCFYTPLRNRPDHFNVGRLRRNLSAFTLDILYDRFDSLKICILDVEANTT